MSEHFGVTGETPYQVARAESLREITDALGEAVERLPVDLVQALLVLLAVLGHWCLLAPPA